MSRFITNTDNPVTDTTTVLTFKVLSTLGYPTQAEAKEAIAKLGEGWRMPDDVEALSIVDRSRHNPAVDPAFAGIIESDWYWTDKPCAWNKENAVWVVGFSSGVVYDFHRDYLACVLAVRSSQ